MKNVKKYLILALSFGLGLNLIHANVFDDFNLICKRYETASDNAQRRGALNDAINIMPLLEEHYKNKKSTYDKALGIFLTTFGISYEQALLERDGRGTGQLERAIADQDLQINASDRIIRRQREEINQHQQDVREREERIRQEQRRQAELQIELARAADDFRQQKIDNSRMQKEHRRELAKKDQDRLTLNAEYDEALNLRERELRESEEREQVARAEIARLQAEKNSALVASGNQAEIQQRMQQLQEENARLIGADTAKGQELQNLHRQANNLNDQVSDLQEKNAELQEQMKALQAQQQASGDEKTKDIFHQELNRKRLEIERLQNKLTISESQRVSTASQSAITINQLKQENLTLQAQNKLQEETMKKLRVQIAKSLASKQEDDDEE